MSWAWSVLLLLAPFACHRPTEAEQREDKCEATKTACASDLAACGSVGWNCDMFMRDTELVASLVVDGCIGGSPKTCEVMVQHLRAHLRDAAAYPWARGLSAACHVNAASLCQLVEGLGKDSDSFGHGLDAVEEILSCDDARVRACGLTAALALLSRKDASTGAGSRTETVLKAECAKDSGGPACRAALKGYELKRDSTEAKREAVILLEGFCEGENETDCGDLARRCADWTGCDKGAVRKLLQAHCHSADCLADAASLFPDDYALAACATGHEATCSALLTFKASHSKAEENEKALTTLCARPDAHARCVAFAVEFMVASGAPERAIPFQERLCARDSGACGDLAYLQAGLPSPKNAPGLTKLDAMCTERDARACLFLARVYKFGQGVDQMPYKSAAYARKACDAAVTEAVKTESCHWTTDVPSTGFHVPNPLADIFGGIFRSF